MTAPLPRCHKAMEIRERPGFPVLPGDPAARCGRPLGHNPATGCRSEGSIARAAAAQASRLTRQTASRRRRRELAAAA